MDVAEVAFEDLTPHEVGRLGEHICCVWLESHGIEVLERNWRCKFGEADVIAAEDGELVFVEVKTRLTRSQDGLMPEMAVTSEKRRKYKNMASLYLAQHPDAGQVRLDVAGVTLESDGFAHMHYVKGVWMDS